MNFWLTFMILWALAMTVYALAATISLGEDVEKKEKDVWRLEAELSAQESIIRAKNQKIADLNTIVNDPHCRIVGYCEECKKAVYSESLHTYLCGIEEKNNKDYCSDFINKWE